MTHTPRNDAERSRIAQTVAGTFAILTSANSTITHYRAAVLARMNDGLKAATYDGDGRSTGDGVSPVERAALLERGDAASTAAHRLDQGLALCAQGEALIHGVMAEYPLWQGKPAEQKPGEGPCPVGKCRQCWEYGRSEERSDRYANACDICGRWKADHGEKIARPLWELRVRQGKPRVTTADLKRHAPHLLPNEQAS